MSLDDDLFKANLRYLGKLATRIRKERLGAAHYNKLFKEAEALIEKLHRERPEDAGLQAVIDGVVFACCDAKPDDRDPLTDRSLTVVALRSSVRALENLRYLRHLMGHIKLLERFHAAEEFAKVARQAYPDDKDIAELADTVDMKLVELALAGDTENLRDKAMCFKCAGTGAIRGTDAVSIVCPQCKGLGWG